MSSCDNESVNILENHDAYLHQYLTAVFQIHLVSSDENDKSTDNDEKLHIPEGYIKFSCVRVSGDEKQLSMSNYSHFVFEHLMDQKTDESIQFIDKRFLIDRGALLNDKFRAFEDEDKSNRLAYLFNCYSRLEFVKDFANLITNDEPKKLKRYIIDQAALLMVCPYVNIRYSEQPSKATPFTDMFKIFNANISWPADYLTYVKKFFVDMIDSIHNAKTKSNQDTDYTSSLYDLGSDELNIENIVNGLYILFIKKFKSSFKCSPKFLDDLKYINLLIASPILAETFIDLNSPPALRHREESPNRSESSSNPRSGRSQPDANNPNAFFRDILFNAMPLDYPNSQDSSNMEKPYYDSLLGILLANTPMPSPISKTRQETHNPINMLLNVFQNQDNFQYEHFTVPSTKSRAELERTELELDDFLCKLRVKLTDIFYTLLKSSPTVRTKTLLWIESFLAAFNSRSKMWANELLAIFGGSSAPHVSDGLTINFSAVLLNLCKPFCSPPDSMTMLPSNYVNLKMLKVDPYYVEYAKSTIKAENDFLPYLRVLKEESCLIGAASARSALNTEDKASVFNFNIDQYQPNFITRCFFMTHKALHLGFRVVHERFTTLSQENSQIQRRLDTLGISNFLPYMSRDSLSQQQQDALNRFDHNMTVTLSIKSTLIETSFMNILLEFYVSTAAWINNLAICETYEEATAQFKEINLEQKEIDFLKAVPSKFLELIPEFIVENIIDFMLFLRHFELKPKVLTLKSGRFDPFLTMIILFMGSPTRMRNPHLRAKMAEMFESLLPTIQTNITSSYLENLFLKPFYIEHLFPALLNVFVSIEISEEANNGDVVAFEQKFNYRRPMYVVLRYLCSIAEHQHKLAELAKFAEENMDSVQSPIFLRFINLLINDAIFLLDEGLSLMSKLRELQQERESGSWNQLPSHQRQQNEANYAHLGRLAKFHNFIGRDTISALAIITVHVKSFFSHRILVDRMASMLNYFLHHLVGPNKQNFKVKQMFDYEFNPGELVKNICRIYVNLACNNPVSVDIAFGGSNNTCNPKYKVFCLAIGQDDRSYSPDLLSQANEILSQKLGQPIVGEDILTVDRTVKELLRLQQNREIPLDDIPEDFLDPLMSTLMTDPVILPNSRKVVDRATITRHLLSDHTDPYTRTPLTMDMLIPDTEMKKKIEDFVAAKLKELGDDDTKMQTD